uniref:Uncharacterized protein n=1 Tax=Rhizophagus irregularis (strain DAOM 181602 / DAOM 197198 / MUCL 43194) TaxID=747089 RepID=U9SIX8_RHIID
MIRKKLLERAAQLILRGSSNAKRNTITKTFFNFSYKSCKNPTSFVMLQYRRACVNHQKIFLKQMFKNIKTADPTVVKDTTNDFINDKSSHANLLFHRWIL